MEHRELECPAYQDYWNAFLTAVNDHKFDALSSLTSPDQLAMIKAGLDARTSAGVRLRVDILRQDAPVFGGYVGDQSKADLLARRLTQCAK